MNELISVIIPLFNNEYFISKCVESICSNSYKNLEILIIDDGSTDNSSWICDKLSKNDPRIKVFHKKNSGPSDSRNFGISVALGTYIAFVDSDDYISGNYFEELLKTIIQTNSDLSICSIENFGKFNNTKNVPKHSFNFKKPNMKIWYELNSKFLLYGPVNKLYKTEIIKSKKIMFDKKLYYGEDLVFNFEYLKHINQISCTSNTKYFYRHDSEQSLSKKYRNNRYKNELILHRKMKNIMKEKNVYDKTMEYYLYHRLFDTAYNCLFDIVKNENKNQQYTLINEILNDSELSKTYKFKIYDSYSTIIVFLMKHKMSFIIMIWLNMRIK